MNTSEIKGDWTHAKEKLKARWEGFSEQDLRDIRTKVRNLNHVHTTTGKATFAFRFGSLSSALCFITPARPLGDD